MDFVGLAGSPAISSGTFIELVPVRWMVFSYGWQRAEVGVPPGSTTV